MLAPWLAQGSARDLIAEWSDAAQVDLAAHGTTSPAEAIRDTAIAQPLILAASLLAFRALADAVPALTPSPAFVVAGHSVGEFAAAAIAGALTPTQAIALVAERGRAMAECANAAPTGMAAVIGGQRAEVLAHIADAGLTAANINGAGQVVAAGPLAQLSALEASPPPGTRIRRLDVAGAFHTAFMADAESRLSHAVTALALPPAPGPLRVPVLSNLDGSPIADRDDLLARLTAQVCRPVRWDLVLRTMASLAIPLTLELAPAGVLSGLVRRELPEARRLSVNTPDDAAAAAVEIAPLLEAS
jgi:[acyl-carrier-protein] S-malonyltransferase